MPTEQKKASLIAAYKRERAGYEARKVGAVAAQDADDETVARTARAEAEKLDARIEQVNAQLRSLGADAPAKQKRAEKA